MNYIFNKTAFLTLVVGTMVGGVSLINQGVSASPESSVSSNLSINETLVAQAQEGIETQPGPEGRQVQLISTKIAGKILHVSVLYIAPEGPFRGIDFPIGEVSYIDDNTGQQYGVVKNEAGEYLAAPKSEDPDEAGIISFTSPGGESYTVWFKFPAPSPETQSISINIPGVAPFVGVPVQ